MRVFNRIIVLLILAGIFLVGFFGVIYCLGVLGYDLAQLDSPFGNSADATQTFLTAVEEGRLSSTGLTLLIAVAVVGLVLLFFELKRATPRRVRLNERSTFATRAVVKGQAERIALENREVLSPMARVKARRKPGAKIRLGADVRQGTDVSKARRDLETYLRQRFEQIGLPKSALKVRLVETDPRGSERRVG